MKLPISALRKSLMTLLVVSLITVGAVAQTVKVTGKVTDSKTGEGLPGVSVIVKGTQTGTATDINGAYSVNAQKGSALDFSFVGYNAVSVKVEGATLNVQMTESTKTIDEVVVIGYGSQKKSDKTGAVTSISSSEMNQGVVTTSVQALQGKASGVQITKKGGNPNDDFSVKIRGQAGLATGSNPLYVVDGVPGVDPNLISPNDIESFNVLKDASSAAIYGSRGANGVIIITTKKGSKGVKNLEFNGYVAVDNVAKKLDLLSASDIRGFIKKNNINFSDAGASTDWQDEIYHTGITQNYNLAMSGGDDNSTYRVSGSWSDFQGVVKGTARQKFTGLANLTQSFLNKKLTISSNISASFEDNDYEDYNGNGPTHILYQAFQRSPLQPVYNADGTYYENPSYGFQYNNPIAIINNIQNTRSAKKVLANATATYEFVKGFTGIVNGAYTRDDAEYFYFVPQDSPTSADKGTGKRTYQNNNNKLFEATLNYNGSFGKHNISAVGGYSWQKNTYDDFYAQGWNAQSTYVESNNLAAFANVKYGSIGSSKNQSDLISFFGRAMYNYDSKYFITATVRRDGSSKFGVNNKWGWFPSASAGWTVSSEPFMDGIKDVVNNLKLRVGYGLTGNQEGFSPYWSKEVYYPVSSTLSPDTGLPVVVFTGSRNANPDLKWETNKELNVGVDFGIMNNLIQGSVEYYDKKTTDLIAEYSVSVPPYKYNKILANAGQITNKGIEVNIQVNAINKTNLTWKTSAVFSHNNQTIDRLSDGEYKWSDNQKSYIQARGMVGQWTQILEEGGKIGTWYLPHFVGMSSETGKQMFATAAGGVTSDVSKAARFYCGNAQPKADLGWSNYFTFYKHFDFSFAFRALLGYKVYNVSKMYFSNPTLLPNFNANKTAVSWFEKGYDGTPVASDLWLEDGSFLRLDNVTIGYTLPISNTSTIKKMRVYFTSNNTFVLTKYSGIDPELSYSGLEFGLDNYNVYPKTRTFTVGLQLNF